MAFDGITLKSVIFELNSCIIGGKINKIFQKSGFGGWKVTFSKMKFL